MNATHGAPSATRSSGYLPSSLSLISSIDTFAPFVKRAERQQTRQVKVTSLAKFCPRASP